MSTKFTKFDRKVFRETEFAKVYSKGYRTIVVGLEPGDLISFRLKAERRTIAVPVSTLFRYAAQLDAQRVRREKAEAKRLKKEQRK